MNFPYGKIETDIPPNFAPPDMWPEYADIALPRTICAREAVGGASARGIRWSLWPITLEEYVGDTEPDLAAGSFGRLARNRIVFWRRVRRTTAAPGWHETSGPWRIDGFTEIRPGEDYKKAWQNQPRRKLRTWTNKFLDKGYRIEPIDIETYEQAYRHSTVAKKIGPEAVMVLKRKHAIPLAKESMELFGVRNTNTGEVIAGICLRYSAAYNSSCYETPFILPEAKRVYAMVALIDLWHRRAQERGIPLLVYNCFWQPGEPKSWRAFSLFKSHFGPKYVAYPPTLWRFVRGKMF